MGQDAVQSEPADEPPGAAGGRVTGISRRAVLRAGTFGAAAAGALAAFPGLFSEVLPAVSTGAAEAPALTGEAEAATPALEGLIVAHIRDAATGDLSLYVGEREIIYRDLPLVQQLTRAAHH